MSQIDPLSDCPRCAALDNALAEAVSLLAAVDSDANNVQLDIMRWRRRHHSILSQAGLDDAQ